MKTVKHRFLEYPINPDTKTLILGTFNPDTPDNIADFFYGRSRNYLWRLLPIAYGESDLKKATKQEKIIFIDKYNISLVDLIEEVQVEDGQEANYYDGYIDSKVSHWRDIKGVIDKLPSLKRVGFTVCLQRKLDSVKL
jgi:G:T/U-mismatch repair DNA glycosylase